MNIGEKDPKIDSLIIELEKNRVNIRQKLTDLEGINSQVQKVFPSTLDYRNKFLVDDKVKIVTGFYSTLLNYIQELNRSIKEEIEIRRKNITGDEETKDQDIRNLVKQLKKDGLVVPIEEKSSNKEQIINGLTLIEPDNKEDKQKGVVNG
jgi:hypothetical protein